MIITVKYENGTALFSIDDGDSKEFSYDNLDCLVDVLANAALSGESKPTVDIDPAIENSDGVTPYADLLKEIVAECFKQDFIQAVKDARSAENDFQEKNKNITSHTPAGTEGQE